MTGKVLISVQNRFIKNILIKDLLSRGFEVVETTDEFDLPFKLDIHKESLLFYIVQISANNYAAQYKQIEKIRKEEYFQSFPVMVIVSDGSKEYVHGAKEVGVNDIFLEPKKRELLKNNLAERLTAFIKKIRFEDSKYIDGLKENALLSLSSNEELQNEIKRASRGKYSVSFVMGRLSCVHIGIVQDFYDKLAHQLRDTDKILNHDYRTFIMICPFTTKENLLEIEKKARQAFEVMLKEKFAQAKLHIYSATYPNDSKSLEEIIGIMQKGINDSIVISTIKQPLNTLSRTELSVFKKMLQLYK